MPRSRIYPEDRKEALAVISPHALGIYSGGVAEDCLGEVLESVLVILGPNHSPHGATIALMAQGSWICPWEKVAMNIELCEIAKVCLG